MKHLPVVLLAFLGLASPLRAEPEMHTNVYVVPPTFMDSDWNPSNGWTPVEESPEERYKPKERLTARAVLERAGIEFPPGASAIYNPESSRVIVRNTPDQMAKVEEFVESLFSKVQRQIYVTIREASFQGELSEWVRGDDGFPFIAPGTGMTGLFGFIPVLREVPLSRALDSYDSFREELARPPKSMEELGTKRDIGQTATLTDPQFQVLIRRLSRAEGIDILPLPSVMVRSGQPALVEAPMKRYGVIPVLGEDETTIKLDLFLPEHGKALFATGETALCPTTRTSVEDGGTVVIAERNASGENRLVFVTAQLLDSAGMPIPKSSAEPPQAAAMELPEKTEPDSSEVGEAQATEHSGNAWMHVVGAGETLGHIARDLGVGVDALRCVNRLGDTPVKPGQILLVPARPPVASRTEELLKSFIVPGIDFKEGSLVGSLATLQMLIMDRHDSGLFPDTTPIFVVDVPDESLKAKITLHLTNVPAAEALRYLVSLADCRYQIEGREVHILPLGE